MQLKNIDKTKQFTRGGQITFHNVRMWLQVNKTVWNMYLPSLLMLVAFSIYVITPNEILQNAWYWCLAKINPILEILDFKLQRFSVPYHGKTYNISPKNYLSYAQFVKNAEAIIYYLKAGAIAGFILSLGIFYAVVKWLTAQGEKQTTNQFIRGTKLDSVKNVAKMINKQKVASDIIIDEMPMIANSETKHFLVHGSTGSGKTQLISKFLDCIRKRGDKVLIYDKGGIYTSTFYRAGEDKILNPFDARSENWDLWHEARTVTDFENMASSLIPTKGEVDPFWVNSARTIFGSAVFTMQNDKDRSIKKLLNVLLKITLHELHNYLKDTDASRLTSEEIEKTAFSVLSVVSTYSKSLKFLTSIEQTSIKPKFCIRDWIHDKDNNWLFLSSNDDHHESLIPLLSMWFSMATITLLSLQANSKRRIWFICDEFPSLHELQRLPKVIAEARKYGVCFILGMQNTYLLEDVYGEKVGRGILDLLNTSFFFRSPSPDIAEYVSKALGSQEIEDMRENYSYGANNIRDGISIGTQKLVNPLVIPSEIMSLDEMKCYLKLLGAYPITLLKLVQNIRPEIAKDFIPHNIQPDSNIEKLIEEVELKISNFYVKKLYKTKESNNPAVASHKLISNTIKENSI
ncbi:type IV secretion system protein VirD4 [Gammaproteobacteria bacterium]